MTGALAVIAGGRKMRPITATNWGLSTGASPQTSAARALTVPAGNPGVIKFTSVTTDATFQYSKNGGSFATVTEGLTVSVANSDTITFKLAGSSGNGAGVTVKDNTTNDTVGTWAGTIL